MPSCSAYRPLFVLDSAGGGLALNSILVLYLYLRFHLSAGATGAALAAVAVLAAITQPLSARLATRVGLVRTIVFTHLPANICLIVAGLVPTAPVAIGFLLLRAPDTGGVVLNVFYKHSRVKQYLIIAS